jgi:lipid II:glycine glycyltransferase (peptidoglycan interpeptide bridge formation enzyme)
VCNSNSFSHLRVATSVLEQQASELARTIARFREAGQESKADHAMQDLNGMYAQIALQQSQERAHSLISISGNTYSNAISSNNYSKRESIG